MAVRNVTNDLDICYSRHLLFKTSAIQDICCSRHLLFKTSAVQEAATTCGTFAKALLPCRPGLRHLPPDLPFVRDETTLRNGSVFTLATDLGSIDLLAKVSGIGDDSEVRANSIEVDAFDRRVWTLDLPGLIRAKRAAGRENDLRLLPELESLLDAGEWSLFKCVSDQPQRPAAEHPKVLLTAR